MRHSTSTTGLGLLALGRCPPAFATTKRIDVLVVDASLEGLGVVRDFHLLFPEVKIVVIVDTPAQAARARWTGATSVVLRSAPRSRLTAAIQCYTVLSGYRCPLQEGFPVG